MTRPSPLEIMGEGRDAANLVLGAMLGGYLGLTISKSGVHSGDYLSLGVLLVLVTFFVMLLNGAADRIHRRLWGIGIFYLLSAPVAAFLAFQNAERVGVDRFILLTIFICWFILIGLEIATFLNAIRVSSKENE